MEKIEKEDLCNVIFKNMNSLLEDVRFILSHLIQENKKLKGELVDLKSMISGLENQLMEAKCR